MHPPEKQQRLVWMGWSLVSLGVLFCVLGSVFYDVGDSRLGTYCLAGLMGFLGCICIANAN